MIRDDSTELRARIADAGVDAPSDRDLDAIFAAVAAETVDRPRGAIARLRELPTPLRVALATGTVLLVATLALLARGVRGDLGGEATARFALGIGGTLALFAGLVAVSLRGVGSHPLGWRAWAAIGAALAAPLVLAVAPWLWETSSGSGAESVFGWCGATGLVAGALTAAIVWVFQRDQRGGAPWRAFAAVTGGGLTAFVLLQLQCPSTDLTHLIVAHASAGVLLAAALVLVFGARSALTARA